MKKQSVKIESNDNIFELEFTVRDWKILSGDFFREGEPFVYQLGVYDNFTVSNGIPKGSKSTRYRNLLQKASEQLLKGINRDIDLLIYDYQYLFTGKDNKKQSAGRSGFKIDGYFASISTNPKGFCTIRLSEMSPVGIGRQVGLLDIRNKKEIQTDNWGILKIYKRKSQVTWHEELPKLIDFLKANESKQVTIYHNW